MLDTAETERRRISMVLRAGIGAVVWSFTVIGLTVVTLRWTEHLGLALAITAAVTTPVTYLLVRSALQPTLAMFRALAGTVASYRDGDFAFSLAWKRSDELGELVDAHNLLGDTLRDQRLSLVERELLLDTMVQNTPVAMLLFGPTHHVVYANLAARKLLNGGQRMEGQSIDQLLAAAPEPMREAFNRGGNGLFMVAGDPSHGTDEEIYSLSRSPFRLNGRQHELFVLRHLTNELRRQEVRTWKKVIRVISHELNNSLAPIASLAHSGAELVRREQTERLSQVFATIADRARHLETFIGGYARFAKLPTPRPTAVDWSEFLESLKIQVGFDIVGELPKEPARFDRIQLEQALVNLLGNAHETGTDAQDVTVRRCSASGCGLNRG